jgi:hypothetical protein
MKGSSVVVAACALFSSAIASPAVEKRATISNPNTPPVSVKGNGQ